MCRIVNRETGRIHALIAFPASVAAMSAAVSAGESPPEEIRNTALSGAILNKLQHCSSTVFVFTPDNSCQDYNQQGH